MSKLVAILCLLAAVSSAGVAVAAKPKKHHKPKPPTPVSGIWKGERLDFGSDLRFRVTKSAKKIGTLKANVLENCLKDEPQTSTTISTSGGWKVTKGKFGGNRTERLGKVKTVVTVAGQFTSRTRASGVIRQRTTTGGVTCDTGRLPFVASP